MLAQLAAVVVQLAAVVVQLALVVVQLASGVVQFVAVVVQLASVVNFDDWLLPALVTFASNSIDGKVTETYIVYFNWVTEKQA